ncbi:MAG: DUF819 family protein [Bacteroidota bacterium]
MQSPLLTLFFLCLMIVVSEWLVRNTLLKYLGTTLLVILLTAVIANLGWVPSASAGSPLYDGIFNYVAPMAIFLLLLEVDLKSIRAARGSMIFLFFAGALGTVLGSLLAFSLVDTGGALGDSFHAIAGMLTGTYIGGSVNFNAVALEYGVMKEGNLFAGTAAIDNIITAIWMILSIVIPKSLQKIWPRRKTYEVAETDKAPEAVTSNDRDSIKPLDLALLLGGGALTLWVSDKLAGYLNDALGISFPSVLILTTIALVLAQSPRVKQIAGAKTLGLYAIYLFLAVIGAFCELAAVAEIGSLAVTLLFIIFIIVSTHGLVTFVLAGLFKQDWELAAVASQANVGGPSSALALAESLDREDLLLPSILIGTLGYGVGTYLGFAVAGFFTI